MTACQDEPVVAARPAGSAAARPDEVKADYVKDLRGAWADCHDTVDGWAERRADYAKQYDKVTRNWLQRLWPFGKSKD